MAIDRTERLGRLILEKRKTTFAALAALLEAPEKAKDRDACIAAWLGEEPKRMNNIRYGQASMSRDKLTKLEPKIAALRTKYAKNDILRPLIDNVEPLYLCLLEPDEKQALRDASPPETLDEAVLEIEDSAADGPTKPQMYLTREDGTKLFAIEPGTQGEIDFEPGATDVKGYAVRYGN